jgi:hypothetical protein
MLRKIAVMTVMSTFALALSATALAGSGVVLRVVTVKTDDVATYAQEIDKARGIIKRLGVSVQTRVWRATFAGPNAGTVVVSQEFPSMAAMADGMTKVMADPEYVQWLKGLDRIRTVLSDSLYMEQ